jgi:hypothetical protein
MRRVADSDRKQSHFKQTVVLDSDGVGHEHSDGRFHVVDQFLVEGLQVLLFEVIVGLAQFVLTEMEGVVDGEVGFVGMGREESDGEDDGVCQEGLFGEEGVVVVVVEQEGVDDRD